MYHTLKRVVACADTSPKHIVVTLMILCLSDIADLTLCSLAMLG